MTLLNAPAYDERKEQLKKAGLIGAGVAVALLVVLTLGGYISGHGWLFSNLPAERRVSTFFAALESKDYPKAFAIYNNDPDWQQHPEKYKDYPLSRFTEDWTTASDWHGPVKTFHVDVSKRDDSGTVVAATVNNSKKRLFLKYQKKDGTLSYFPLELQY